MNSHCRSGALFATPLIRRTLFSSAALLTGLGAVRFRFAQAAAAESPVLETHLGEVPLASGTSLSVERRGQVALLGLNRPQIQNRIDPATFRALAKAYFDYDHDPSLRAAVLFGHGEHFSRGIDVDAFKSLVATQQPWITSQLFLVADIRVAAANANSARTRTPMAASPAGERRSASCGKPAGATRCATC